MNHDQIHKDTVVLDVRGKVTIGHDTKMRDAVAEALDNGARNILLNMQAVTKLDSSGIGEIVAAHIRISRYGGRLLLVGLPHRVATVLQVTNLLGVIELYDNPDEAVAALDAGL